MRQQCLGATGLLLNPLMTALRERTVPGEVMAALCLSHIVRLFAGRIGKVEWDIFSGHGYSYPQSLDCVEPIGMGFVKLSVQ